MAQRKHRSDAINEHTLFATIAMYLSENDGLVLVVEGDDDCLALEEHCSPDLRLIAGIGGKPQILKTASLAQQRGVGRARFLIDKDYDSYDEDFSDNFRNVIASRTHDLFIDMVESDESLLINLIKIHTAPARRRPKGKRVIPSESEIRAEAIALAAHLAAVRVVATKRGISLKFDRFPFGELKVKDFNSRIIAKKVIDRSSYAGDDTDIILDEVEQVRAEFDSFPQPPIGDHDLFRALARLLKCFNISVSYRELQRNFIFAVTCTCRALTGTKWFQEIQEWCTGVGKTGFTCQLSVTDSYDRQPVLLDQPI